MNANTADDGRDDSNTDNPQDLEIGDEVRFSYHSPITDAPVEKTAHVLDISDKGTVTVWLGDDPEHKVTICSRDRRGRRRVSSAGYTGPTNYGGHVECWSHKSNLGELLTFERVEDDEDDEPTVCTDGGSPEPQTTTEADLLELVEDGTDRTTDLLDALDVSEGHLQKVLKDMTERGLLSRHREGGRYVYEVPSHSGGTTQSDESGADDGLMPADRSYLPDDPSEVEFLSHPQDGFENMTTGDVGEYFATDGELRKLLALVDPDDDDLAPFKTRCKITGPSGCGKTTLVQTIAAALDATFVTVQASEDMSDKDLLGKPSFAGGETQFVDGPVPRALMASNYGPVVLLIDEFNRAPANAKNALFSALDHRGEVRLDGPRGGEVVSGVPENIHVFATLNEGDEYHGTHRMDHAEDTRFTYNIEVDYLAADPADEQGIEREAELLVNKTGLHADLARDMVKAVAEIRRMASDSTNTDIDVGAPTRTVLDGWAPAAERLHAAGFEDALIDSAQDTILSFYDEGDDAYEAAMGVLESRLQDAPIDPDEYASYEADEVVSCGDCSYSEPKPDAESRGVMAMAECPECSSGNITVRAR